MDKILSLSPGPSVLIHRLCEEIDFVDTIDRLLQWDSARCTLSPGQRIEALVINILSGRDPLYQVRGFYQDQDVELLFGQGVTADALNDDALARALDKLYEASPWKVYSTLSLHALAKLGRQLGPIHCDTTSFSLEGAYERESDLSITYGYSKDRRPDLKQILLGLGVTPERIPILANMENGDTSDKTWNFTFIRKLRQTLSQEDWENIIYVADSALITKRNLKYMARLKLRFVSRLPELFSVEQEVKEQAWKVNAWQEIGSLRPGPGAAEYRTQSFIRNIQGRSYRLVVVYSSKLDERKERSFHRQLEQEEKTLRSSWEAIQGTGYHCEADARQAIESWNREHKSAWFTWEAQVQTTTRQQKRPHRGRPKKDEEPLRETVYLPVLTRLERNEAEIEHHRKRLSTFVLISNAEPEKYGDADLLCTYKGQESAETRFRLLKDPQLVDGIYLKTPERIAALGIVLVMALLLYGILEDRIRRRMEEEKEPLRIPGRPRNYRPTGQVLLSYLQKIRVILIEDAQGRRRILADNANELVRKVVCMAGYEMTIYTESPTAAAMVG
ncbi:MAG: IS1634 family transposase [Alicyclobacillus sp.]|nr:IS1634 family transposase [Alicyclobacillus sp.]